MSHHPQLFSLLSFLPMCMQHPADFRDFADGSQSCLCKAEFCYICATPWKGCGCDLFNDPVFLTEANRRVDRQYAAGTQANRPLPTDADGRHLPRAARVQYILNAMREQRDCRRHRWLYTSCESQAIACEDCIVTMDKFLWRCKGCQGLVCNPCKKARRRFGG